MSVVSAWELWHIVRREAERRGAHHVRMVPLASTVEILFDVGGEMEERHVSPAALPALAMRLQRLRKKSGWHVETFDAGFGTAIHILRVRSDTKPSHPADWSSLVRALREEPQGLTVLVGPDAYVLRHLSTMLPAIMDAEAWKTQEGAGIFDADDEEGRELALQAALRGRPSVAVSSRETEPWWEALDGAVSVRVLKGYRTIHGPAWEAFPC